MARSFSKSIANAAVRAMKEAERERIRAAKARQKIIEKQAREIAKEKQKAEKERYIESRHQEAIELSENLINRLDEFNDIALKAMKHVILLNFQKYRKKYVETTFVFKGTEPRNLPPELEEIPKESWLDNIFSSRVMKRIKTIERNEEATKCANEAYEQSLERYNVMKKDEYESWQANEQKREEEILRCNQDIDEWERDFSDGKESAVLRYIEEVFDQNWLFGDTIKEIESGYIEHSQKAIIEIHLKNKTEVFPHEGYKYFKTRDSIEPVKMKVAPSNQRLRELAINIAMATLHIIYGTTNVDKTIVNEIVVNVFHEGICCVSGEVVVEQFNKLDFNITSHYDALLDNYFKVAKQFTRGIKPYERIYIQLGLE